MSLVISRWFGTVGSVLVFWAALPTAAGADQLTMSVHPVLSAEETRRTYQPLASYLKKKTGHDIQILTSANFLVHWQFTRRGQSALLIEGPHMVDYRIKKMGYTVLAKMPEVISYTLVAHPNLLVLEPQELVGKSVATLPAPSLGAVRLNEIFPNPLRQPILVEVDNMEVAVQRVMEGKASGAIIPSAMVGRFPDVNTVANTAQAPAPGITAAPWVSEQAKRDLRQALLAAQRDPEGQAALQALKIGRFEEATPAQFDGYARLLEGMWGY
jgi:phosphonate transport system substrate-binding protein